MNTERWRKIESLYHLALRLDTSERSAFLKASCGEDEELLQEVESLVAHTGNSSFMEIPVLQEALDVIPKLQEENSIRASLSDHDWTVEWSQTLLDSASEPWSLVPPSPILAGEVLANRYRIIAPIGQGGMGQVYEAEDLKLEKRVALKTIRSDIANNPEMLYRFKNEFRALADVIHPSLVRLYDVMSDGSTWFFTMELIRGTNFLDYVGKDDDSRGRLRNALAQLVEAVLALHAAGKLHRDIKPSNILIGNDGRLTLIDFGLVTELISEKLQNRLILSGTPAYLSPEQALGQEIREASDWYGVGTLLYEALTGELPFEGTCIEILREKISREPPAPSKVTSGIPEDLSVLTSNLLRFDPAARPTGSELLLRTTTSASDKDAARVLSPRALPDVFVGRQTEISQLDGALFRTRNGQPVTVHLSGKSGIGKTALIRRFLKKVIEEVPECVILAGRCYERETVPFNALDSLIDALSQYCKELPEAEQKLFVSPDSAALSRLFPVLRQIDVVPKLDYREFVPDSRQLRLRAFAALREILGHIGQRKTLILYIDDLQWADADSIALLKELFGGAASLPVLFLFTYRDEPGEAIRKAQLAEIRKLGAGRTDVCVLQLEELTTEEATELASRLIGDSTDGKAQAEAIAKESGGMPFFVDALVRYSILRQAANLAVSDKREAEDIGVCLDESIHFAISNLPAEARELLEIIATAGEPLDSKLLSQATGIDIEARDALPMLRMENLVHILQPGQESKIEMYHDRVRQIVASRIPAEAQKQHYQRLARTLESSGCSDSARLAVYFHRGGDTHRAGTYAIRAADQAAEALAFDRAAQLYRLAIEARNIDEVESANLRCKLADALVNAGKGAEAASEFLSASKMTNGVKTLVLKQRAAEQLLRSGHIDDGFALLYELCKEMRVRLARTSLGILGSLLFRRIQLFLRGLRFHERAECEIDLKTLVRVDICWAIGIGWSVVDTIRGSEAQTLFLLLALKTGEPYRISLGLSGEAAYSAFRGDSRRSADVLPIANELAQKVGRPHAAGLAIFCQGMCEWVKGNWESTVQACQKAQRIYTERCTGVTWEIDIARIFELASLAWMGRWTEHSQKLPLFRKEAENRGDLFAIVSLPLLTYSYMMLLGHDDAEGARQEIKGLIHRWSQRDYHVQHFWAMHGEVEAALYCGNGDLAYAVVNRDWRALKSSLQLHLPLGAVFAYYLRARTRLEKARANSGSLIARKFWLHQAEQDAKQVERRAMSCSNSIALLIRGAIASINGRTEAAVALLARAETGFEHAAMTIHAAVARRRRGELMGNEAGRTLVSSADAYMATQEIKRPGRITAVIAPGF